MSKLMIFGCVVVSLCGADVGRADIIDVNTRIEGSRPLDPSSPIEVIDGPAPPTVVDIVSPAVIETSIRVRGQSQLSVFGGILGSSVIAFDESTIRIHGGEIAQGEDLEAWNNSRIEIWGGTIGTGGDTLQASDHATIFVHGGIIRKGAWVSDFGRIEFFGRDLTLQSDIDAYIVSGILADNTPIYVGVTVRDNGSVVLHNIPEPTAIGMLWWGMMLVATLMCSSSR